MFNQATARRDAFTFSLGGMATIASVVAAPAVAHDRLNKDQNDQPKRTLKNSWQLQPLSPLHCHRFAAPGICI